VEIHFKNKKLQELCQTTRQMKKKWGNELSQKLMARLADLDAASNVSELIAGRPHPLDYDRKGQFAIDLNNMMRLIFEPANDPIPKCSDGTVDWKKVTVIRIICIGDYHG
jgi:toxin HigB-1